MCQAGVVSLAFLCRWKLGIRDWCYALGIGATLWGLVLRLGDWRLGLRPVYRLLSTSYPAVIDSGTHRPEQNEPRQPNRRFC